MAKKTNAQLAAENELLRRQRGVGSATTIIVELIRWGGLVAICGFGYLAVDSLAGKETDADIGVQLLSNISFGDIFAFVCGGGGVVYGLRERKLRRSTIEHMGTQKRRLEEAIDPKRISSGLTPRGETNPADK